MNKRLAAGLIKVGRAGGESVEEDLLKAHVENTWQRWGHQ